MIGAQASIGPWGWYPHLFLWALVGGFGCAVTLLHQRIQNTRDHPAPWPRVRAYRFVAALVAMIIAMGWPLGGLAAHWSLIALVIQRSILVLVVAPLLLSGLPDDVIRWATRPVAIDAVLMRVLRPPAAVVCVTVLLVGTMVPPMVTAQSHSMVARGLLALVVVVAGLILWLPIMGRVPGIARPRPMIRAVYLVAQSVVPVFLSFVFILATRPLYPAFSGSTDGLGLTPLGDQQVAGFVSKLSFLITLLAVAAVILSQAPDTDDDFGPEDPLVWADIERHFERADRKGAPSGGSMPEVDTTTGDPSKEDVEPPNDPGPGHDQDAASE